MPISFHRKPGPPTTRSMVVDGRPLRIDVRPGTGRQPPLLLVNGVGASLELLQPFVDALDPALEVIRFDVPGVGGSPLPGLPYRFTGLSRPSTSPCSSGTAAGAWCWSPRRPAR
jgi:pimeloyl-ACP methyl ester carboxylesterase